MNVQEIDAWSVRATPAERNAVMHEARLARAAMAAVDRNLRRFEATAHIVTGGLVLPECYAMEDLAIIRIEWRRERVGRHA